MTLEQMLTSLECCNMPIDEGEPCKKCPYYNAYGTGLRYQCIDKRYEDLKKVLQWAIDTQKTLKEFTKE